MDFYSQVNIKRKKENTSINFLYPISVNVTGKLEPIPADRVHPRQVTHLSQD